MPLVSFSKFSRFDSISLSEYPSRWQLFRPFLCLSIILQSLARCARANSPFVADHQESNVRVFYCVGVCLIRRVFPQRSRNKIPGRHASTQQSTFKDQSKPSDWGYGWKQVFADTWASLDSSTREVKMPPDKFDCETR